MSDIVYDAKITEHGRLDQRDDNITITIRADLPIGRQRFTLVEGGEDFASSYQAMPPAERAGIAWRLATGGWTAAAFS